VYQVSAYDMAGNKSAPSASVSVTTEAPDPTAGLLGYWRFDEDRRATATDSSGSGHTGTILGPSRATGKAGGARDFDGVDDHVRIVADPSLNNLSAVTMAAWIYPRVDNHGHVLDKGDGDKRILLKGSGQRLMGLIRYTSGGPATSESADNTLTLGVWQHVALTWSASDNRVRLYRNGTEVAYAKQDIGSGAVRDDASHPYTIGIRGALGPVNAFNGIIDEVRLYDRVLSAHELRELD